MTDKPTSGTVECKPCVDPFCLVLASYGTTSATADGNSLTLVCAYPKGASAWYGRVAASPSIPITVSGGHIIGAIAGELQDITEALMKAKTS